MLRFRLNCSVIWLVPSELCEVIVTSPGIWPNCRSSEAVISVSIVSRAGAGKLRGHLDGREVHLRQGGDRQRAIAERAGQQDRDRQQPGRDRSGDEGGGDAVTHLTRRPRLGAPRSWCRRLIGGRRMARSRRLDNRHLAGRRSRREAPSITTLSPAFTPSVMMLCLFVLVPDLDFAPRRPCCPRSTT